MAEQEGKVPGKPSSKEAQNSLEMCAVAPRGEGDNPGPGLRGSAFTSHRGFVAQAMDPWANWQELGLLQSGRSPACFFGRAGELPVL